MWTEYDRLTMKISIRKKIIIVLSLFLLVGGSMWFLNYYKHYLLNQKLQILEKKDDLFNTILEARRYEKNYFLYMGTENLEDSLAYVHQAEQKLVNIIERYGRYTVDRNLENKLDNLRQYEKALSDLLVIQQKKGLPETNPDLIETFSKRQENIRTLARKITVDMEESASSRSVVMSIVSFWNRKFIIFWLWWLLLRCQY